MIHGNLSTSLPFVFSFTLPSCSVAVAVPKAPVSLCSTATSVASKGGLEEVAPIATVPTAMVSSPSNQATMPAKTVPLVIPAVQPQCVAPAPEPDTQERVQLVPCLTQPASPQVDATPMEVEQPVDPAVHAPEPQDSMVSLISKSVSVIAKLSEFLVSINFNQLR